MKWLSLGTISLDHTVNLIKCWFLGKSCPGGNLPCNGNGVCDLTTGICVCQSGTKGTDCSGMY